MGPRKNACVSRPIARITSKGSSFAKDASFSDLVSEGLERIHRVDVLQAALSMVLSIHQSKLRAFHSHRVTILKLWK